MNEEGRRQLVQGRLEELHEGALEKSPVSIGKLDYDALRDGEKRIYNRVKLLSILLEHGYMEIEEYDIDDSHAHFVIKGKDGSVYPVRQATRPSANVKFLSNPDLVIAFPEDDRDSWYLINHIELIDLLNETRQSENDYLISDYIVGKVEGKWSKEGISLERKAALKSYKFSKKENK